MKKLLFIILVIPFFITNCEKDVIPNASFSVSRTNINVGENIYFYNSSNNMMDCRWDFGDGNITNIPNPNHLYSQDGVYSVKLTVWSSAGYVDNYFRTVTVLSSTILNIQVLEYFDEYPVKDASVILYSSLDDWYDEYNPFIEGYTDYNGNLVFDNMPAYDFYIDVWESNHNNYILADEDIDFIHIPTLYSNEVNYYTAWVDYVPGSKKSKGKYKIKKIERREFKDKVQKK